MDMLLGVSYKSKDSSNSNLYFDQLAARLGYFARLAFRSGLRIGTYLRSFVVGCSVVMACCSSWLSVS